VGDTVGVAQQALNNYWRLAVEPFHHVTWQTLSLFAVFLLVGMLFGAVVLRYSWIFSKPKFADVIIKHVPHTVAGHLRLSPPDYLKFHGLSPMLSVEDQRLTDRINKDVARYYLVTVVEKGKRKPLLYKEMRLHVATRRGRVQQNAVQFDQEDLTAIRLNNGYEEDDQPDTDLVGSYNVYVRRVRFYDVRHWLMHPSREIRTLVWVTLITTTIPTILDLLFG
jgi:hypothetical protein